jgi:hypothetical protein
MKRRRTVAAVILGTAAAFLATACGSSDSGTHASARAGATTAAAAAPGATTAPTATAPATPAPTSAAPATHAPTVSNAADSSHRASASSGSAGSGGHPAGKSAGASSPIRTTTLVDGSTALIYRRGDTHYVADVVHDGQTFTTLETTNGHVDGLDANDMFIVLDLDGTIHSWMGGAQQGPGTFTLKGDWTAKVTKVGELHYRAVISGGEGEVATLEARSGDGGRDAGVDANGVFVVLGNDGQISSHM